ncbi:Gpi1-domain-containing protein [Stereum hirsutum FP-91666 SS1]|uniref:Gpi1-domain-containing protein n=1 Tax=Stereum hirsutum (strain FP-91666) TaxID=721885 RepID=UPI000440F60E|nr:Gpi1-domain-containing protein [Stereum hirsutum FP-91666 SS1]EIM90522.1 Gpi1-domain-containing protein [Stereum hirsutum FP-91666 SS1]
MTANSSCFVCFPEEDLDMSGYIYGWSRPAMICVAGVIPGAELEEHAQQYLERLLHHHQHQSDCCTPPTIVGRYKFSPNSAAPEFSIHHIDGKPFTVIHYQRSAFGTLTMHSDRELPLLASHQLLKPQPKYDIPDSAPRLARAGLDEGVLAELNCAQHLQPRFRVSESWVTKTLSYMSSSLWNRGISTFGWNRHWVWDLHCSWLKTCCSLLAPIVQVSYSFAQIFAQLRLCMAVPSYLREVYQDRELGSSVEYIQLNNTMWLLFNDLILGFALGSFIREGYPLIATLVSTNFEKLFLEFMTNGLIWLDAWPAGLKLNNELSHFFCQAFLGAVGLWKYLFQEVSPYLADFTYFIGLSGYGGLTVLLSVLKDSLTLSTLHVRIGFLLWKRVVTYQVTTLRSLWNLFRGKRHNMLHNHIDSWHYEIDQLLLGTILFTLFTFSLPTVLAYAALFVFLNGIIYTMDLVLTLLLALIKGFPLFPLLLKAKDPRRLPGTVYFVLEGKGDSKRLVLKVECILHRGYQAKAERSSAHNPATIHIRLFNTVELWEEVII